MDALEIVKTLIGGSFVLFIPGFAWSYLFFKQNEIDWIERIALSFGLSIALIPLVLFWLNYVFRIGVNFISVTAVIAILILIPVVKIKYEDRIEKIWRRRK